MRNRARLFLLASVAATLFASTVTYVTGEVPNPASPQHTCIGHSTSPERFESDDHDPLCNFRWTLPDWHENDATLIDGSLLYRNCPRSCKIVLELSNFPTAHASRLLSAEPVETTETHEGICTGVLISGGNAIRHPKLHVLVELNKGDWVVQEQSGHHCIIGSSTANRQLVRKCGDGEGCEVRGLLDQDSIDGVSAGFKRIDSAKPVSNQASLHVSDTPISYVRAGNVFVKIGTQERQLTFLGRDSDAVLSPDSEFIAFTRSARAPSEGPPDECTSGPQADELRRINIDGSAEEVLVLGRAASKEVSEQLCSFDHKQFSSTGDHLFFLSPSWVTSAALHSYDFRKKQQSYVIPANVIIVLNFCADKHYRDALVVNQHRYRVGGGSYDWYWLYDQSGRNEIGLVGDYDDKTSVISALKEMCN